MQEVRFLFPVLPLFNALAAATVARSIQNARKSTIWTVLCLGVLGLLAATLLAKLVMAWAAYSNYPVRWIIFHPGASLFLSAARFHDRVAGQ